MAQSRTTLSPWVSDQLLISEEIGTSCPRCYSVVAAVGGAVVAAAVAAAVVVVDTAAAVAAVYVLLHWHQKHHENPLVRKQIRHKIIFSALCPKPPHCSTLLNYHETFYYLKISWYGAQNNRTLK